MAKVSAVELVVGTEVVVLAIDVDADELCVLKLLAAFVLAVLAVAELDSLGAVVSSDVERARCAALVATRPAAAAVAADVTVVRLVDVATVREVIKAEVTRDVVVARVVGGAVAIVVAGVLAVVVAAEVARVVAAAPQREPLSGDTTCGDAAGMPGLGWPTPLRCP